MDIPKKNLFLTMLIENCVAFLLIQFLSLSWKKRHICELQCPLCLNSYYWVKFDLTNDYSLKIILTHFIPLVTFYNTSNHQKTRDFLMFSWGTKRNQRHETSYRAILWLTWLMGYNPKHASSKVLKYDASTMETPEKCVRPVQS